MNLKYVILLTLTVVVSCRRHLSHLHVRIEDNISHESCHDTLNNLDNLISVSSEQLYNVTQINVNKVTVVLPPTWANTSCVLGLPLATTVSSLTPVTDILIKTSAQTKIQPVQFGGCGVRSRRVILPHQRLISAGTNETRDTGYELGQALLKHEFGYFDTHGRVDDPVFPETFQLGEQLYENCNTDPFKDTSDYKEEAPTKQNIMCQHQSPMSVIKSALIKESVDLISSRPRIEYVISQRMRHLVVLDRSQQSKHVWKHLHNALYRLISSLPEGDEVAVITFGRQAEIRLTPVVITEDNKDGIYSRIPGKISQDSTGCLLCALREASLIVGDSEGVSTKIIVMTSSQSERQNDVKHSLETLSKTSQVIMMLMSEQWLLDQPASPNLKIFHVDENEQKSVSDLYDILALTLDDNLDAGSNQNVKFFAAQFTVESNQRVDGKFVVENNLRDNMYVMTSSVMQEDIELFQLTSPSGNVYNFPILDKGQAYFRFSGSVEAGVWSYRVKLTPTTVQPRVPVYVAAYADTTTTTHGDIQLEGWTDISEENGDDDGDMSPRPLIIYARVTDNDMPVVDVDVVATVTRPDGDSVHIKLHDSGTGYPDLTSGDGIYSAYFTEFSQFAGLYSVKIEVRNHEGRASVATNTAEMTSELCGVSYTPVHHIPSLHFTRFIRIPSFFLSRGVRFSIKDGVPVRKDVFPPARITDLHMSGLSDLALELSWTATGDDLDTGSAATYQLRWAEDRNTLMGQSQANIWEQSELPTPSPFGTMESVNLTVPKVNTKLYFSLVAVDKEGNTSPVSNILPVYVTQEEEVEPEDSLMSHVSSLTLPEMSTSAWVYILSISLATVTLIIIMLLVIIIRRRRMRKLQENCPIPYFIELGPPQHHHTDMAERQLVPSTNTTRDYPDDTLSYPSSPVKTHPVLELYEHHARQYQMYQNMQQQHHSDSCRSSETSDTLTGSDKQSDRESPWQRQYRHSQSSDKQDSVVSNNSDSHTSSSSSHRQSRRRRESFV